MDTIRKILVPTDFSTNAGHALQYAVVLASRLGAALHVFHVVVEEAYIGGGMDHDAEAAAYRNRMHEAALRYYLREESPGSNKDCDVQCAVRHHTEAAHSIMDYAQTQQVDLIVMAASGHPRENRFFIGSTAEKVMRLAPCDVLTCGSQWTYRPDMLYRILVPIDFSAPSALALERARELAKQTGAQVYVLHMVENTVYPGQRPGEMISGAQKSHDDLLSDLALFYRYGKGPDVPHRFYVRPGRPAEGIAHFADRHDVHLIVQGSHGRTGIAYAMLGSVAERIVRRSPCPVFTVKVPLDNTAADARGRREDSHHDQPVRPLIHQPRKSTYGVSI